MIRHWSIRVSTLIRHSDFVIRVFSPFSLESVGMLEALRSPAALCRFFVVAGIGVALDLWTKALAFANLTPGEPYQVIPGWLQFDVVKNHGAVFGLGQGGRVIFVIVSFGAIIFLTYLFSVSKRRWWYQILLGMLLAGVIGNLYDRITRGYVRDMIHIFPGWQNLFPWVFNVADSFLCVGVSLMVVYSVFSDHIRKSEGEKNNG
jgi:signal peptidase II